MSHVRISHVTRQVRYAPVTNMSTHTYPHTLSLYFFFSRFLSFSSLSVSFPPSLSLVLLSNSLSLKHTLTSTRTRTNIHIYTHTHEHMYTHAQEHTHTHTHTQTQTHTHTHTHAYRGQPHQGRLGTVCNTPPHCNKQDTSRDLEAGLIKSGL